MWTAWNIGQIAATLMAAVLALILTALFSRLAYRLPRALDARIAPESSPAHRRYRTGFWLTCPILAMLFAWYYGPTPAAIAAIVFSVALLALAWIDAETGLLPDLLSLSLLWLGLLVNLNGTFATLQDAVLGAVVGYLALWCVCHLFLLFTGRIGMGHGDFKLLAALGAWLGWMAIPSVLLISSSLALAVALALRLAGRMSAGDPLHFGPYLAGAGILALLRL